VSKGILKEGVSSYITRAWNRRGDPRGSGPAFGFTHTARSRWVGGRFKEKTMWCSTAGLVVLQRDFSIEQW
jgi:hypothetical protein